MERSDRFPAIAATVARLNFSRRDRIRYLCGATIIAIVKPPDVKGFRQAKIIMNILDDPTLALLSRFVGDAHDLQLSDAEFLLQQVAAIEHYIKQFPAEERQARALEWIETYALQYRRQWRRQAVIDALAQMRCADCPLTGGDESSPCAIHARWLTLLRRYADEELTSHDYVEAVLNLLRAHKHQLRVSEIHQRSQLQRAARCPISANG